MNTVNASTGFSGFQLHLGHSPRIIPPIVPSELPVDLADATTTATLVINQLMNNVADARDNLLLLKICQTHYASATRNPDPQFQSGDMVMLSTTNRHHKYKKKGEKRVAKFLLDLTKLLTHIRRHPLTLYSLTPMPIRFSMPLS
jgi:hypothetical protein